MVQWGPGPNLPKPRGMHSASLLGDGKVLITGGLDVVTVFGVPIGSSSNDARRYDPVTNQILSTASFSGARGLHDQITLPNGGILKAPASSSQACRDFEDTDGPQIRAVGQPAWRLRILTPTVG